MDSQTIQQVLELKTLPGMTFREYFKFLLLNLWGEGDTFSGKRAGGDSDWWYDLYEPLLIAGLVDGAFDEDGCIDHVDYHTADKIIKEAIRAL